MRYEEYRKQVAAYRESGESKARWCVEHGVSENTLGTWIKRVNQKEGKPESLRKSYEEYRGLVIACKSSGIPATQWCAEEGILYTTYCTWRKKVHLREGKEAIDERCGIEPGRKAEAKISPVPVLCELRR